ncbi:MULTISPECIES: flavin reductase family protein [unclassified Brenneria]|uniref:flavin reductase family protein n=1 Tax=unclassified Brenneria TaxID=2634434 RepID=UPI0029C11DBA|nr:MULTISPECIES: flavin reductase family protein [unclassified Brenneria]MDX5627943.1 flavin reductase family protein [Brenneria sp. L3-3Z]MDX5695037.1 flavin reductase family protein [Brenneria sp. L4-2C]
MNEIKRKKFREYYQPSKIMLGIIPGHDKFEYNIITLCFTTTCSYNPPMISLSIEERNFSYHLAEKCKELVLAIPGKSIANETMQCGFYSGREIDKFSKCNFTKLKLPKLETPGIAEAIANIETKVITRIKSGDHITLFCEVLGYHLNNSKIEKNLISIGPNTLGYDLLVKKGMHRIGVITGNDENYHDFFI